MTRFVFITLVALVSLVFLPSVDAHKPITSKYNYNQDVFPIVAGRCGGCHVKGGIAPMSLLTYTDAIPWAESIRAEITAAHMPPWFAANDRHRLTAREMDILLTWATGGTPEGSMKPLPAMGLKNSWKSSKPDAVFEVPTAFTLGPDTMEDTHDFDLKNSASADRWVRAVDLLPGTPAVVRAATVYTGSANETTSNVLGTWLPGDEPAALPPNAAFRWPAESDLHVRIHYKKTWTYDGKPVTDRSSVGVYFLQGPPAHEVRTVVFESPRSPGLDFDAQVLAVRLDGGVPDKTIKVEAALPDGRHITLMKLLNRPDWNRRYALPKPVVVSKGSRVVTDPPTVVAVDLVPAA